MLNFGRVTNNKKSVSVYQLRLARKGIAMKRLMAFPHAKTGTCGGVRSRWLWIRNHFGWVEFTLHGIYGEIQLLQFNMVHLKKHNELVVSTHLNNGNLPQGVKMKDIWKHHLEKDSPGLRSWKLLISWGEITLFNFMSFFPTKSCTQSSSNSY